MNTVQATTDKQPHPGSTIRERRRQKRYRLDRARGIPRNNLPADRYRARVCALLDAGFTLRSLARTAGLSHLAIRLVADGTWPAVRRRTACGLLQLTAPQIMAAQRPTDPVPAAGAQRRIQALMLMGWRHSDLTSRLGFRSAQILERDTITARKHHAVAQVYDCLWDQRGPSLVSTRRAAQRGWMPPMAWDDDTIDNPAARPDTGRTPRRGLDLDEVLLMAERGWTAPQIGARLGVAGDTVTVAARRAGRRELTTLLARNSLRRDRSLSGADRAAAA